MFKFFTRKSKQIHALFTIFLLLFQNFAPLFFLVPTAKAQTNVNSVALSFNNESNELTLSGEAAEPVEYLITYDDNDVTTPVDAITGLTNLENNKFSADLFVGTCSTDESCTKDVITKGNLSFKNTSYEASFEIVDGQLWLKEGNVFKTSDLQIGKTYVAPQNNQVTVTFTKLPEQVGNLMIEEVILSDEQVAALGALSNVAYDITSNMENGSFEYDLTLPVPEDIEGATKVIFAESVSELTQAQEVESEVVADDQVKAEGLDHFTVFVVVPADVIPSNIFSSSQQGWRLTSTGNASVTLADSATVGVPINFGPNVIKMNRTGGNGNNRSYLGYYPSGKNLNDIEEIKWNRYTKSGTDTYLNIFLTKNGNSATVVYSPNSTPNNWHEYAFNTSSSNIQIRANGNTKNITWTKLMSDYGDWDIENHCNDFLTCIIGGNGYIGGIVFVSGSTSPVAAQEHYYDGITLDFTGSESEFFDFVDEIPAPQDTQAPSVPINPNLNGVSINTNNFDFEWDDSTDESLPITYEFQSSLNPAQVDGILTTGLWHSGILPTSMIHSSGAPDGTWYWQVRAIDAVGNISNWSEIWSVTLDTVGPEAPIITAPTENQYFTTTPILNQWTVPADNSGIHHYRVEYQYDDGHTFSGGPYRETTINSRNHVPSVSEQGGVNYRVQAFDNLGNEGSWSNWRHYYYDASQPGVDLVFPGIGPTAKSFQAVFSESVNPTDATNPANYYLSNWPSAGGSGDLVGDATITYDEPSKTATINFIHGDWYVSPEQLWGVQNIHDLAGNLISENPHAEYSTPMVPPVTTDSGTDANWHNSAVTVTLNCSDVSGSGCKTTYYTTDGSEPTTSSTTGNNVVFNSDGVYTIKYFSVDNAGNVESVKTSANQVKIDMTAPNTPTLISPANNAVVNGATLINDWSDVADAHHYIYESYHNSTATSLRWHEEPTQSKKSATNVANTTFWWRVKAVDAVGNQSAWSPLWKVTIDNNAPDVTITALTEDILSGTVAIYGTVTDNNPHHYWFVIQNSVGTQVAGPGTVNDATSFTNKHLLNWDTTIVPDGIYTIKLEARDAANNKDTGSSHWKTVTVDNTVPSSIITSYGLADGGSIETNEFTGLIEGTATDLTSGINHVLLSISHLGFGADESETTYWDATTSAWVNTESMFRANGTEAWNYQLTNVPNGIYNITSHAVDNAGNVESTYNIRIVYDKTIPEVALAINPASPDGNNGWYRYTKPTITLTASDNYNLDRIEYQWNSTSGGWTVYTGTFTVPSEGQNILYYRSIDSVGNTSEPGIKEVKYDKTNPTGEPLEVKVDNVTSNTADATWKKPSDDSDVSHYRVVWRHENGTEYSVETGKDDFAHQLDRLFNGAWTLIVQAVDSAGNFTEKKVDFRVGPGTGSSESSTGGSVLGATTIGQTGGTAPFITQTTTEEDEASTTTNSNSEATTNQPEGAVLGATSCNSLESYLPIILLVGQLLVLLAVEVLNRDAGIGKLVASVAITIAMIPLYYLLRNPECFAQGTGLDVINNWFAGIAIATGLAAKLIGKSLFEEK